MIARSKGGAAFVAIMAAGLLLSGCAGVTPLPTRTKTPANEEIKQKVSAKLIAPGQATEAEMLKNLTSFDVGIENNQFFLAPWSSSNKGGWIVLCGFSDCVGDPSQFWKTSNALVEFDDQGLVTRFTVFGDGSLVSRLSRLAAQQKTVSFDPPQEVQIEHLNGTWNPATLVLGKDTFALRESIIHRGLRHSSTSTLDFQINRAAVENVRIGLGGTFPEVHAQIHFREKTKTGEMMNVQMSASDLFLVLEFLNQRP